MDRPHTLCVCGQPGDASGCYLSEWRSNGRPMFSSEHIPAYDDDSIILLYGVTVSVNIILKLLLHIIPIFFCSSIIYYVPERYIIKA